MAWNALNTNPLPLLAESSNGVKPCLRLRAKHFHLIAQLGCRVDLVLRAPLLVDLRDDKDELVMDRKLTIINDQLVLKQAAPCDAIIDAMLGGPATRRQVGNTSHTFFV